MSTAQTHPTTLELDEPLLLRSVTSAPAADVTPGLDDLEISGLRLLAAGRPHEVITRVQSAGRDDLVARLLVADAQIRLLAGDLTSLVALVERVHEQEPPGSRLRPWASVILAERLGVDMQPSVLQVAREARAELQERPMPALPPLALRYASARLARIEASSWLYEPSPGGFEPHREAREQALADLLACGFTEEMHATRGAAAGLAANVLLEDICENHERLKDARAAVGTDPFSMWGPALDAYLSVSAFEVGDLIGSLEAYERLERSPFRHPRLDVIHRYGRAFFRLVIAGISPMTVAGIEKALSDVRRHEPRVAQFWYGHITNTLADQASRAAAHFARLEAELPAIDAPSQVDRRLLRLRVDALAGEPIDAGHALAAVDALASMGWRRKAARIAVRLGHDLAAGGDVETAERVHAWGMERLPAEQRRTLWERWWARGIGQNRLPPPRLTVTHDALRPRAVARRPTASRSGLSVRVLAPTVEVEVAGKPVSLSDAQAKLLLALVVAHPAPLHVERASDVLWPEEGLAVTRPRLNSLVHRMRRVLDPHGDAISRSGDLLRVDETRCEVDLWWFQRAIGGDRHERRKALLSVRGNLCDAQFPYDEGFFDERHRVTGEWMRHASRAHRGGEVAIAELEPVLTSLNLTPADLDAGAR